MFIEPDFFGGFAFGEKEKIGVDVSIRIEHAIRQAYNCMQVALL